MLFNSFVFLLVFLPLVLIAFYASRSWVSARASLTVLVIASLIFYGYWNPIYVILLLFSICFNFSIGRILSGDDHWKRRAFFIFGISVNLALLAYFKYANFFIDNVNYVFGLHWEVGTIILPLAISFYTFTQIAYLVDAWRGKAKEYNFLHYCLFITFFPHLIAGPILHHKEMMPQCIRMAEHPELTPNFAAGLSLFIIGLFKKVVIADNFAVYVGGFYNNMRDGAIYNGDAWVAALSYHFQIYFDFSGYSDMAIGLGLLFGIVLPVNFNSPYKSFSIIDFWRRWHITLSRFLRDYLYISLGGNQKGSARRYLNLAATMLIGGLWHGAAWTFLIWGGLHASYLVVNHGWQALCKRFEITYLQQNRLYLGLSLLVTTIAVVVAWVYFRAPDIKTANQTVLAMFGAGQDGLSQSYAGYISNNGFSSFFKSLSGVQISPTLSMALFFLVASLFTLFLPNAAQLFSLIENKSRLEWKPNLVWAVSLGVLLCCSLMGMFGVSEFIYYQF